MITTCTETTAFNDQQYASCYPEGIDDHCWNRARNEIIARKIRRHCDATSPILEIGCGTGVVLRHLRRQGLPAWGADLGQVAIPPDLEGFLYSGADALTLPEEFRDQVRTLLVLDVLEHLEGPEDFVRQCRGAFPQAQRLIATVPARRELWSNYDEYYGHFRRYDLPAVTQLSQQLGAKLLEARYFFHSLYWPLRYKTFMGIDRGVSHSAPRFRGLHRLLSRFLVLESQLMPRRLVGSSLLCVWDLTGVDTSAKRTG